MAPVAVPPRATPPRWAVPASLGLCVVGLGVSAFLAYESATASVILACPVNGAIDCGKVTTSAWSKLFGIPVSYLGLLFFIGMIALCTKAAWTRGSALVHNLRLGGTVVGVAMVLYLVWAELFRIGAICLWCTVVHVVSFALFCVVLFARVLAEPTPAATLRR
ncbi:MAG: vitamin K epoxide reductase family protein [Candidatus Lutibacillus vidarii]|nr:vitamin K epoxide reductase family protein [Candidatus Lutibacillus vidarii]HRC00499.1 vitamin K epoxide reductase family protein [Dermatophilaceae bacterium]